MRWTSALAFSALVLASLSGPSPAAQKSWSAPLSPHDADRLSVMTYNVEGLPFPIALNRTGALQQIGLRLAGLRRQGRQPDVVLLQEAFTPEAKEIAALSGYRFIAVGPRANGSEAASALAMSDNYRAGADWRKGEGVGKWVDSGLLVLSDFPIVATSSMTFADDACAGYDCLASKGVLLTWIKVPGQQDPIAIADTHMNSRHATGVSNARADAAFAEQLREARRFLAAKIPPRASAVFGGDFNIGHVSQRIAEVGATPPLLGAAAEATAQIRSTIPAAVVDRNFRDVVKRAKDKQFYRAGAGRILGLKAVEVPFGISGGGYYLSDHLGYVASYAMR
jgi:hypothetical protein